MEKNMEEKSMSIIGHLSELRVRIIAVAISVLFFTILSYIKIESIVNFIMKPVDGMRFIYTAPADLFVIYMKISFICGMVISVPIIIYNIWNFIKPGLKKKERSMLLMALSLGSIGFILGVSFAYFIVTPIVFEFFIQFSRTMNMVDALFTLGSYIAFLSTFLMAFGVVFEMPVVIMILSKIGIISPTLMKNHRKMAILAIFIFATILTPPDIVSQMLVGVPMVLLYEASIFISKLSSKKK